MAMGNDAIQPPVQAPSERRAFVRAALLGVVWAGAAGIVMSIPLGAALILLIARGTPIRDSVFLYLFAPLSFVSRLAAFFVAGYTARRLGPASARRGRLGLGAAGIIVALNALLSILQQTGLLPEYRWILHHGHFVRARAEHYILTLDLLTMPIMALTVGSAYLGDLWAARRQAKRARERLAGETDTLVNLQEP